MIDPTEADIGRRVRYWSRHRVERLGEVVGFDGSGVWCLFDGDPTPRRAMRCMLTWDHEAERRRVARAQIEYLVRKS